MKNIILISTLLFLVSCGQPVPDKWKALQGVWTNQEIYMEIDANSKINYLRQNPGTKVSINSWITSYEENGFNVDIFYVKSIVFKIDKNPFIDTDGKTKMIMDGRLLTKQ